MAFRAVVAGINVFQNYPQLTLHGCVNDADDMTYICTKYLGFQGINKDITVFKDSMATKANIMGALKSAVNDAKAGKVNYIVFTMSSHGTQVPDLNGDETTDHVDEAFCPTDLVQKGNQWDRNHLIVDDELHNLFLTVPADVLVEVWLDTCHSGTGLKAIDTLLPDRQAKFVMPSAEAFDFGATKKVRGLHTLHLQHIQDHAGEKNLPHQILWAACRDNQTSADAKINNVYHGAFTYYFKYEIDKYKNNISRKDLLSKVRDDLKKSDFSQVPQLECPAVDKAAVIQEKVLVHAMA